MKHPFRTLVLGALLASPVVLAQPADKAPSEAAAKPADPVKLLDPGAEPRRALRYAPTKGDTFGFELRMKMAMEVKGPNGAAPSPSMPTMVMGGDVKVLDVTSDGNAKVSFVYGEGRLEDTDDVAPQVIDQIGETMRTVAGISGEFVVSNRGEYISGDFNIPKTASALMRQTLKSINKSMEQFTTPLPIEPVGKGAVWTIDRVQDTSGLKLDVKYTQELTQLSEKFFSLKSTVKGEAKEQRLEGITVSGLSVTGEGEQQVDMARMMPLTSRVAAKTDMEMDANGGMSMSTTMTVTIKLTEPGKFKAPAPKAANPAAPNRSKSPPKF